MEFEELEQGRPEDDPGPAGLGPLTWTAIAVVAVLAGLGFLALRNPDEPAARPSTPRPVPTAAPQQLTLGRICSAVITGRTALAVSFTLVNVSDIDITLTDVEPVAPVAGLRRHGGNTAGGTCEHPGTEAPGGLLMPGRTQLITMRFRVAPACPHPHLEESALHLRAEQMVGTTTIPTSTGLGAISVPTCIPR